MVGQFGARLHMNLVERRDLFFSTRYEVIWISAVTGYRFVMDILQQFRHIVSRFQENIQIDLAPSHIVDLSDVMEGLDIYEHLVNYSCQSSYVIL